MQPHCFLDLDNLLLTWADRFSRLLGWRSWCNRSLHRKNRGSNEKSKCVIPNLKDNLVLGKALNLFDHLVASCSDNWREGDCTEQHKISRACSFCILQKALGRSCLLSNSTVKKPDRVANRVGSRAPRHILGQSSITICSTHNPKTSNSRGFLLPHFLLHDPYSFRTDTCQHRRHRKGCSFLETAYRSV